MSILSSVRPFHRWAAAGVACGAAAWAAYSGITWFRYGQSKRVIREEEKDPLLDRFIPTYEVVERHQVRVAAPADMTFAAATDLDFQQSAVIRAIFKARECILGSKPDKAVLPQTLLAQAKAIGWGVLAEVPGRQVVVGAVTRPWEANVVFRALPPGEFAAFHEPGYAKIVWTLRGDPISASESMAATETRVTTTDPGARARFRRYWACLSPGILLIRRISLNIVRQEAERCAREAESKSILPATTS